MTGTTEFLKRASEKLGFRRDHYVERNVPTSPNSITILPFYGDMRSTFVVATMVLNQYKRTHPRDYLIVCSWPGFQDLFGYADEFWSLKDKGSVKALASDSDNMDNTSDCETVLIRNLNQHFQNVLSYKDLHKYYNNGFQEAYQTELGGYRLTLPELPASNVLPGFEEQLASKSGTPIVVFPSKEIRMWQQGESHYMQVSRNFWSHVIGRLLTAEYVPVLYQSPFTMDMSTDFTNRCLYLSEENILPVLAGFRRVGCVLDIHSGISRLAIAARCPFMCLDERMRFINQADYEIDDLCCDKIPKRYLFSLGGLLLSGSPTEWDSSFMDSLMINLSEFIGSLKKEDLASTTAVDEELLPQKIRDRVVKRMGVKFISSSRENY